MALEREYQKFGKTFQNSYWRVVWAGGDKHKVKVVVDIWASEEQANPFEMVTDYIFQKDEDGNIISSEQVVSKEYLDRNPNTTLDRKEYTFTHEQASAVINNSSTLVEAAYLALKSLPEFDDAVDV